MSGGDAHGEIGAAAQDPRGSARIADRRWQRVTHRAGNPMKRLFAIVGLGLVACGSSSRLPSTPESGALAPAPSTSASAFVPGGPLVAPCRLGKLSPEVGLVPVEKLLATASDYYGKLVRTRGYFVLEHENISLLEPTTRATRIMLDVSKLPANEPEQLTACRLKLVEVQGYLTHVPMRGGEKTTILAEAMVSPP